MPFVEIELGADIIKIRDDGSIFISKNLRDEYFDTDKVAVFIDEENNLLGLKPSDKGYKLTVKGRVWCNKIVHLGVKTGTYTASWSAKHQMVIIPIEMKG